MTTDVQLALDCMSVLANPTQTTKLAAELCEVLGQMVEQRTGLDARHREMDEKVKEVKRLDAVIAATVQAQANLDADRARWDAAKTKTSNRLKEREEAIDAAERKHQAWAAVLKTEENRVAGEQAKAEKRVRVAQSREATAAKEEARINSALGRA